MELRVDRFRTLQQNIWFHVMNVVFYEMNIMNKNMRKVELENMLMWNAWSPMHSKYLKTEEWLEKIFDHSTE